MVLYPVYVNEHKIKTCNKLINYLGRNQNKDWIGQTEEGNIFAP